MENTLDNKKYGNLSTTYNIVTSEIEEIKNLRRKCVFKSCNKPYEYLRTTFDNRIIIGGYDTKYIPNTLMDSVAISKYETLEKTLRDMFPELKFKVDYKYYGAFKTTNNNLPYLGKVIQYNNVYYNLSYGGNGIVYAMGGGEILLELLKGKRSEYYDIVKLDRK